ncbi:response regulator transcription factor [candidate division KSB1 bacterium]
MSFTIVLAEDEPQIARLTSFKLEKEGFKVIWEKDGGAALKSVEKNKPDIVLLDIMMPVMDGYQVLKKIKENDNLKNIPVIMLTAKGQERDVVKGIEMGAEDYIVKPFRPAELTARVKKILGA